MYDLLSRVPQTLAFLAALTVCAECAWASGVFDSMARALHRLTRGRVEMLWSLYCIACVVVTMFLSLDTTAVLMTTLGLMLAQQSERPALVFALPALWIANMGSLWLPVSNLTNLLARSHLGSDADTLSYLAHAWPVALAGTSVPIVCAAVGFRQHLRGAVPAPDVPMTPRDVTSRRAVAVLLAALCAGLVVWEPWIVAVVVALLMASVLVVRNRAALREVKLPWRGLGLTAALFVTVAGVQATGVMDAPLRHLSDVPTWHVTLWGAALANVTNNLPAYLALEPATHTPHETLALLVGVNVASGITWWGSVATLLWRERLRRADSDLTWRTHLRTTGAVTLLTTAICIAVLPAVR